MLYIKLKNLVGDGFRKLIRKFYKNDREVIATTLQQNEEADAMEMMERLMGDNAPTTGLTSCGIHKTNNKYAIE